MEMHHNHDETLARELIFDQICQNLKDSLLRTPFHPVDVQRWT